MQHGVHLLWEGGLAVKCFLLNQARLEAHAPEDPLRADHDTMTRRSFWF